jgi:hypothetical protein
MNYKHPTAFSYEGGLNKLAEDLSNLSYDSLAAFLKALSEKVNKDSVSDEQRKRLKLSKQLAYAAKNIGNAWKICEPYMKD